MNRFKPFLQTAFQACKYRFQPIPSYTYSLGIDDAEKDILLTIQTPPNPNE